MRISSFLASALVVALLAGQASAALGVVSQWFSGEQNKISDNSAEFLFNQITNTADNPGTPWNEANTTLDPNPNYGTAPGDLLVTGFRIDTVEGLTSGGTNDFGQGGVNFFTGISVIELVSTGPGASDFTFGPASAVSRTALAASLPLGSPVAAAINGWQAGTMIGLYDDMTDNFLRVPIVNPELDPAGQEPRDAGNTFPDIGVGPFANEDQLLRAAVNGSAILELGFTGLGGTPANPGEFWVSRDIAGAGITDIAVLASLPVGSNIGAVDFGLNVLVNGTPGVTYGTVPTFNPLTGALSTAQWAGNANLQGIFTGIDPQTGLATYANTPFDAFDDLNANFQPNIGEVPEASSIAIWSLLGLAGFGFRRFRK